MGDFLGPNIPNSASKLFNKTLGVVQLGFDGWNLGFTSAEANIEIDEDIQDIFFQQLGTKASDHFRTGADVMVNATFAELNTNLIALLWPLMSKDIESTGDDAAAIVPKYYESMVENESGVLRIVDVENTTPSNNIQDTMTFYNAIPLPQSPIVWEAATQKNFVIQFKCKLRLFQPGESTTYTAGWGYIGDPSLIDMPAANWPDRFKPFIESETITGTDTIELLFNKSIALVLGVTLQERFVVSVNNTFIVPITAIIGTAPDDNKITLTFAAASFAALDVVLLSFTADSIEDSENRKNIAVSNKFVTNIL